METLMVLVVVASRQLVSGKAPRPVAEERDKDGAPR